MIMCWCVMLDWELDKAEVAVLDYATGVRRKFMVGNVSNLGERSAFRAWEDYVSKVIRELPARV